MVETVPAILTAVTIGIFIFVVWLAAFREWKRRERHNELMTIWERFRKLKPDEMRKYQYYEESFFIIAKGGKRGRRNAFISAYTIGYLEGKGETKHE